MRQERGAGKGEIQEAKDRLNAAVKARNEFVAKTYNPTLQQKTDVAAELTTANVEKQAAEQERQNVIAENDKKIALAQRSYESSLTMAAEARNKEAMDAEQLMHEQRAYALNMQHLETRQLELQDATDELRSAESEYASKLRKAEIAKAAYYEYRFGGGGGGGNGGGGNGGGVPAYTGRKRSGAAANNTDNAGFTDFAKPENWD